MQLANAALVQEKAALNATLSAELAATRTLLSTMWDALPVPPPPPPVSERPRWIRTETIDSHRTSRNQHFGEPAGWRYCHSTKRTGKWRGERKVRHSNGTVTVEQGAERTATCDYATGYSGCYAAWQDQTCGWDEISETDANGNTVYILADFKEWTRFSEAEGWL